MIVGTMRNLFVLVFGFLLSLNKIAFADKTLNLENVSANTKLSGALLAKSDKIIIRSIVYGDIEFKGEGITEVVILLKSLLKDEWWVTDSITEGNDTWLFHVECSIHSDDQGAEKYDLLVFFPVHPEICKNGEKSIKALISFLVSKPDSSWIIRHRQDHVLDN